MNSVIQIRETEISWNFILDKKKLTETELHLRFQEAGQDFFCKDVDNAGKATTADHGAAPAGAPATSFGSNPLQDFEHRYIKLCYFLQDLANARMKEVFRVRCTLVNQDYPDCVDLESFLEEYKHGAYDNKKRWLIDQVCNQMWGDMCFGGIEKMVMDKLKLKYKNTLIGTKANGEKLVVVNRRCNGSIKQMLVRMKQTLFIDRFRQVSKNLSFTFLGVLTNT